METLLMFDPVGNKGTAWIFVIFAVITAIISLTSHYLRFMVIFSAILLMMSIDAAYLYKKMLKNNSRMKEKFQSAKNAEEMIETVKCLRKKFSRINFIALSDTLCRWNGNYTPELASEVERLVCKLVSSNNEKPKPWNEMGKIWRRIFQDISIQTADKLWDEGWVGSPFMAKLMFVAAEKITTANDLLLVIRWGGFLKRAWAMPDSIYDLCGKKIVILQSEFKAMPLEQKAGIIRFFPTEWLIAINMSYPGILGELVFIKD